MAKGATSKNNHSLSLCFVILLSHLGATLADGTDSLSCNFIVKYRSSPGQCSVNGNPVLHLGDGKQEGNATDLCPPLSKSLEETFEGLWKLQSGNDALNVTIQSQYKQGNFTDGHWAINIDEKYSIYFYPSNETWRESHSDASSVSELWKNKKEVEHEFIKFSKLDVCDCLNELWPHSREMPRSTMKALDTTQPTYAPQIHPTANITQHTSGIHNEPTLNITQNNSSTQSLSITWTIILGIGGAILIIIIIIIIIFLFSRYMMKKKKGAPCCSSSSADLIASYNWVTLQHIPVVSPAKETHF
ncbi:histocompatibility antigen 60b-like [Apodemus sylvaticus]|uniref:histocompatibility antigen 60b-like n=1 Tax=Apodemus sylvaticus TaxID=10129 RepID=UPI002243D87D|nr:histocompatibility antigen 60b-like [Apodemus sylvaticus]